MKGMESFHTLGHFVPKFRRFVPSLSRFVPEPLVDSIHSFKIPHARAREEMLIVAYDKLVESKEQDTIKIKETTKLLPRAR